MKNISRKIKNGTKPTKQIEKVNCLSLWNLKCGLCYILRISHWPLMLKTFVTYSKDLISISANLLISHKIPKIILFMFEIKSQAWQWVNALLITQNILAISFVWKLGAADSSFYKFIDFVRDVIGFHWVFLELETFL